MPSPAERAQALWLELDRLNAKAREVFFQTRHRLITRDEADAMLANVNRRQRAVIRKLARVAKQTADRP
jgi:hypothetical protein